MDRPQGRARRWAPFGETVFTEFTALAVAHGAINLGQGSPGFDGPDFVKDAAAAAMARGDNQYAPMSGVPELKEVVAARFGTSTGIPAGPPTTSPSPRAAPRRSPPAFSGWSTPATRSC